MRGTQRAPASKALKTIRDAPAAQGRLAFAPGAPLGIKKMADDVLDFLREKFARLDVRLDAVQNELANLRDAVDVLTAMTIRHDRGPRATDNSKARRSN